MEKYRKSAITKDIDIYVRTDALEMFFFGAMGREGRGAKTSATLFGRVQQHIKSLPFSLNNITKYNKKTH